MTHRVGACAGDRAVDLTSAAFLIDADAILSEDRMAEDMNNALESKTVDAFRWFYQRSQLFSKFDDGDSSRAADRQALALSKFASAEVTCGEFNSRLVDPWSRHSLNQSVLRRARAICIELLGRFGWESFPSRCGFGPGASVGLSRRESSQQNKWVASTHITPAAIPYYSAFYRWAALPIPSLLEVSSGNRVTTVPKSFKTDRTIAIEPDWNMFLQKGVGALIRTRLQRRGILLPDAQDKNRALARLGSWTGHLATLDMSAASDTISAALVEMLLPEDWVKVIFDLRSPEGTLPSGESVTYAKVSSMGNGYTFELETLIFYALTLACCRKGDWHNVAVYGDDIIVPTDSVPLLVDTLTSVGFAVNDSKSFWDGPFRESCGGHYWKGRDVTPFFIRRRPETKHDLIVLGNHTISWCARAGWDDLRSLRPIYTFCRRETPKFLRGPYGVDGCLWDEWDRCTPKWHKGFQSYSQCVVQREHKYVDLSEHTGAYFHKLWMENPELESSRFSRVALRERIVKVQVDRDQWHLLPVRTALP